MSTTSTTKFSSVLRAPSDIHLLIVGFLDPLDIISFSETCRTLNQISYQRAVWIMAFHRMCRQNKAFVPSYPPIQEMSITELRHHALAPYKMLNMLHPQDKFTGQKRSAHRNIRTITCPSNGGRRAARKTFERLFLVPGGRFLVLASRVTIEIWDLGMGLRDTPCLVTKWCGPINPSLVFEVCPSASGREVLIVVYMEIYTRICILSCDPSALAPEIRAIASFNLGALQHGITSAYLLTESAFIYGTHTSLTFWDFRNDLWASYNGEVDDAHEFEKILFFDDHTILTCSFSRPDILGWKIPELLPRAQFLSQNYPATQPPLFVLPRELPDGAGGFFGNVVCPQWYSKDKSSIFCDTLSCSATSSTFDTFISSFQILPHERDTGSKIISRETSKAPLLEGNLTYVDQRRCNDYIIRAIPEGDHLQIIATAPPVEDLGESGKPADVVHPLLACNFYTTHTISASWGDSLSFDPLSGRFCMKGGGGSYIEVLDYLHGPPTT